MLLHLKPQSKQLVYDLVTQAGVDTSDWANFEGAHPAANPKYCFDWAFWDESKKTVVVCLWFSLMREEAGEIFQIQNMRALASMSGHRDPSIPVRAKRARRLDMAFQLAYNRGLPVRVIVVDGIRRGEDGADASDVERRMLDPVSWSIVSYDRDTGDCCLKRGIPPGQVIDQFTLDSENATERRQTIVESFVRSPEVRARVLTRSGGRCESCNASGFLLPDGRRFLETHHIIPLSEDGPDIDANVIAICPNEHREAHYGKRAADLQNGFKTIVEAKLGLGSSNS